MRLTGFATPGGVDGLVFQALLCGVWAEGIWFSFATVGFDREAGLRFSGRTRESHLRDRIREVGGSGAW